MSELVEVPRYVEVLWDLVRRNLKVRHKNSVPRFVSSLLDPLLQVAVLYLVCKILFAQQA